MKRPDELISIIVPVYNAGHYIEEAIAMVQAQTYTNWELILVDDCSTDDGCVRIEKYITDKIRLMKKDVNEGAARARNTGIRAAKGRYIAFLDADDVWMKDKLEKELAFMKEKQAAFVFTAYEFGDERAKGTGKVVHVPKTLTYHQALSRTVIFTTTVLIDTNKTGRELIQMPAVKSEDTATWWKILRSGFTAYGLNEVLAVYRRPVKSLSSNKLKAVRRIWNLYRKEEKLSFGYSVYNLFFWALRATLRRL
ncbi:glycosyltransferase family 2 protein [Parablautia muri]|uniref:Glycosyltransferase family 2 protein n=1 Tax=Parablautia muri TaxID=2320879 RepID=A0A9X5BFM5_9FIRM|nr:glycosyltransferase family 2 protein [Parablautia muri]NBJ92762.1 glycosyltransferase family 2 protein [Parablautia muri]